MRALTNSDVRWINGIDTLTASGQLRRLRGLGLLIQKGKAAKTYYLPSDKLLGASATGVIRDSAGVIRDSTQDSALIHLLPAELVKELNQMKKRAKDEDVKVLIKKICREHPCKLSELATLLKRDKRDLRKRFLMDMVKNGELELLYPHSPTHNQQAYLAKY